MKKKKVIIISSVAVVAVAAVALIALPFGRAPQAMKVNTNVLAPTTLVNTVSATGIVESADAVNVFAPQQTAAIKTVTVAVGDKVAEGDLLCQYDTASLELEIAQQKASLNSTDASMKQKIESAQHAYDTAKSNLALGQNGQVVSAENQLKSAKIQLSSAEKALENLDNQVDDAAQDYVQARKDVRGYQADLKTAKAELKAAEAALAAAPGTPDLVQKVEDAKSYLSLIETRLAMSESTFEGERDIFRGVDAQYLSAEASVNNAKSAVDGAQKQLEVAILAANQQLDSYLEDIKGVKLSANNQASLIMLEKLEKQLQDATVKAPCAGTITAVNAKAGANGTGVLFVIENTGELKISTTIKEYDLPSVAVGMKTEIKSDATGETVIAGEVSKIAPTAVKNADGSTRTNGNVEFEIEVKVASAQEGLKIGMNARVNIQTAQKENVYGVPFDAIFNDAQGSYVLTAKPNDLGEYIVTRVPVTTGMETNFYMEISGEGLADGTVVILVPTGLPEGSKVLI